MVGKYEDYWKRRYYNWHFCHATNSAINPFPKKPLFLRVHSICLLKTLWENFSFSRSVFYQFGELSAIFIEFGVVVCKLFQFGRV